MPRTHPRRLVVLTLACCAVIAAAIGLGAGTVSAHNTLLSSDPADGASVAVAPSQITWTFNNAVPLETMTVTLIDATGARSELPGSAHGPGGDTEVVTPLPALQPGAVSLRRRLVGPDGHPITGRVDFTLTAPAPTTILAAPTLPEVARTSPPAADPTPPELASSEADGAFSTPSFGRWVLRYGSYLAIMAIVGILLVSRYVWPDAGTYSVLRRVLSGALLATAVLGFLQLLVISSDVSGKAPWASFGFVEAATTTDAGMAFMIRILLALTMWMLVFQSRIAVPDVFWTAVSLFGFGLLATWAFAGHSRSMRWPAIGVAGDVAHHAAAALWIAGLAIVGWIVIPQTRPDVLVPTMRRFSRVAAISVGVLVVTGLAQTVRLVGSPTDLFDANHGRYLVGKVVVLAAMLGIANANRRRVDAYLDDAATLDRHVGTLRKAVLGESAIGLVIIGITASMVVSPPSTSQIEIGPATGDAARVYYIL